MKGRLNKVRRRNNSIFILCGDAYWSLNFLLSCPLLITADGKLIPESGRI
ncbi:unnamed protein product [Brugia timori]|uniref:Uncharacterized protein n=1 Tax=Brugia timori TaxID=42155 RepID=A0A0R3QEX3_9BILA|nr:unnamed protein product [Brugia timori]